MFNACVTIPPEQIDLALTATLFEDDETRGRNGKVHGLINAALPALRDGLERKIIFANRTARPPRLCAVVLKRVVEPRRDRASSGALVFMRLPRWIANNPGARRPLARAAKGAIPVMDEAVFPVSFIERNLRPPQAARGSMQSRRKSDGFGGRARIKRQELPDLRKLRETGVHFGQNFQPQRDFE